MAYHFFAMVSRMKYIDRWALMRNTRQENLTEHSHEVAVIAHALAVLRNRRFGGHVDAARAALWASTMTCLKRSRATFPPQSNIIILKFGPPTRRWRILPARN